MFTNLKSSLFINRQYQLIFVSMLICEQLRFVNNEYGEPPNVNVSNHYVELAPAFNGDADAQDAFLDGLWIQRDFVGGKDIVRAAHRAWNEHIMRKRAGTVKKRPIADVMIGAFAMQKGGLITRNEADFRTLYPMLPIFNPISLLP